jgi:hypothetical protein
MTPADLRPALDTPTPSTPARSRRGGNHGGHRWNSESGKAARAVRTRNEEQRRASSAAQSEPEPVTNP